MGPDKLFELNKIKFGVTPGCRVAHILADGKGTELVFDGSVDYSSGYGEINPAENYINEGDKLNKDNFIELAEMAEELYQKNKDDKYVANMLFAVKDYLTASSHEAQHNALKMIQLRALEAHEKFEKDIAKYQNKEKYAGKLDYAKKHGADVDSIAAHMTQLLKGGLVVPQDNQPELTKDPANTFMGHSIPGKILGNWQTSVKELFPHTPCPNDIKQGVGLMDCFMMAQLCNIAREHPEEIKNAMCDNGDGTVTVRFYHNTNIKIPNAEPDFQPEYIRVNKTVNQDLFGNNYYASSSLWVQMMEKAFAEYARRHLLDGDAKKRDSGMGAINRGQSNQFLEAFTGKPIVAIKNDFGVMNSTFAVKADDGSWEKRPEYYLPEEEQLYNFFKTCVNDDHDSLTCGTDMRHGFHAQEIKDLGIRTGHAYSITKLFEKDGKYFVQVRDPYATFTPNYDETGKLLPQSDTQTLGNMIDGAMNVGRENMGAFNLELKDFLYFFGTVDGFSPEKAQQFKDMTKDFHNYDYVKMTDEEITDKKVFEANYDKRYQEYKTEREHELALKGELDAIQNIHKKINEQKTLKENMGEAYKPKVSIEELEIKIVEHQEKLDALAAQFGKTNPRLFRGKVVFGEPTQEELDAQKEAQKPENIEKAKEIANEFEIVGDDGGVEEMNAEQPKQAQPEQVQADIDPDIAKDWVIDPDERDKAQKDVIMGNLKGDNFGTLATNIKTVYENLNMTSRYFSWMNSDEYNKMFSKLESVNKKVQAIAKDFAGEPDENQAEELAEDIMQLSSLNDKYIDHKFGEINKNLAKGKTSNERAFFRMSGALSLSNLFSGAKPMTPARDHSMAAMDMMMKDIRKHILLLEENENVLGPSLEESKKVEKGMEDFLRKNPKVNDKLEAYRKSKMQTKEQEISNNDFEIVEDAIDIDGKENIKAPEKGLGM